MIDAVKLIDADKLRWDIRNNAPLSVPMWVYDTIDAQPTAYDIDKVIEQLEELRYKDVCDHLECEDCLYNEECGIGTDQTHNVEVDTAIKIVKDGGKNDD